jgi:hypothetical protein
LPKVTNGRENAKLENNFPRGVTTMPELLELCYWFLNRTRLIDPEAWIKPPYDAPAFGTALDHFVCFLNLFF